MGQGSVVYIKSSIGATEISLWVECDSCVWCKVQLANADYLLVGVVYHSPHSDES
jgi:hypothetical protein